MNFSNQRYFFDLLQIMTEKEIRARYKYTIFGFFWIILNPLLQMLVIGFIFNFLIKEQVENYYYFLFTGLLSWNFFSLSLTKSTPSIVYERALVKKARFPQIVIPLSIILSNLFHFIIALSLLLLPTLFFNLTQLNKLILIIPFLIWILIFSVGISLITSTLNVKYRDINFFVQALLILWFYATPVIYPLNLIPQEFRWLWDLNPLTAMIQLLQLSFLPVDPPNYTTLFISAIVTIAVFIAGVKIFNHESKNFDDWI